jgi:hypothetical protein
MGDAKEETVISPNAPRRAQRWRTRDKGRGEGEASAERGHARRHVGGRALLPFYSTRQGR